MFTGIIKELGEIKSITEQDSGKIIKIFCPKTAKESSIDDSIAVNGVCLTVIENDQDTLKFQVISESLEKTNLSELVEGDRVNIEPALKLNQGIDGHLVQGHVDQIAKVKSINNNQLQIETPNELQRFISYKGSITISGVSLTVSRLEDNYFQVDLIDHTIKNTNFQYLKAGSTVNLEIDLIARYLDRLMQFKAKEADYQFLRERNLI